MSRRTNRGIQRGVEWFDRLGDVSPGAWTALAAWLAVVSGRSRRCVYAWRQYQRAKHADRRADAAQRRDVHGAQRDRLASRRARREELRPAPRRTESGSNSPTPPTVGKYESAYEDRYVDIAPLNLPAEIPYLAPTQEWRIVWDSALDRRELGEAIASRFDGAVTYSDEPKRRDQQTKSSGSSSGRRRCWTGRRCIPSSGSSC